MRGERIMLQVMLALQIAASLYRIPSVRLAFDQLAYEDAMRG